VLTLVVGFGIFSLSPWRANLQDRLLSGFHENESDSLPQAPPTQVMAPTPIPTVNSKEPSPINSTESAPSVDKAPVIQAESPAAPAAPEQTGKEEASKVVSSGQKKGRPNQNIEASVPTQPQKAPSAENRVATPPIEQAAAPAIPEQKAEESPPQSVQVQEQVPTPAEASPAAAPEDPWKAQMAEWTEQLKSTPSTKYTIQIEISGKLDLVRSDYKRLNNPDAMVVGFSVRDWNAYTLIVGIFDSRAEGNEAIKDLPAYIQKQKPLVKTMNTIKKGLIPVE